MDDWYSITRKVVALYGPGLFKQHNSLYDALKVAYPNYAWQAAKFVGAEKAPSGYWKDPQNLLDILSKAEEMIGIKQVNPIVYLNHPCSLPSA